MQRYTTAVLQSTNCIDLTNEIQYTSNCFKMKCFAYSVTFIAQASFFPVSILYANWMLAPVAYSDTVCPLKVQDIRILVKKDSRKWVSEYANY